jgi:hypothetical protein
MTIAIRVDDINIALIPIEKEKNWIESNAFGNPKLLIANGIVERNEIH